MQFKIRKSHTKQSATQASSNRVGGKLGAGVLGLVGAALFATQLFASTVVNINTADAQTIADSLDGIGPVKAQAIVDYRNQNGLFSDVSDIMNVTGIGEATYTLLKTYLSIGGSPSKADPVKSKTSSASQSNSQAIASSNQ